MSACLSNDLLSLKGIHLPEYANLFHHDPCLLRYIVLLFLPFGLLQVFLGLLFELTIDIEGVVLIEPDLGCIAETKQLAELTTEEGGHLGKAFLEFGFNETFTFSL